MNCSKTQRWLLNSECPDQPAEEVQQHLTGCAVCRAYQDRLVRLEQQLPHLPVPPSARREAFLLQIRVGEPITERVPPSPLLWLEARKPPAKERGLQKLAVALAMAAALAIFALSWWAWPHPTSPLVLRQQHRNQLLDQARTPRERVEVLARLADSLQDEARKLLQRRDPEQLKVVAVFYTEVVCQNLLEHANNLPLQERHAVLDGIAERLNNVESEVTKLAVDAPANSAASLRDIAMAARKSHNELRALLQADIS